MSSRDSLGQETSPRQAPEAPEHQEIGEPGAAKSPVAGATTSVGVHEDPPKDAEKTDPENTEPQDAGQQTEDPEESISSSQSANAY